MTIWKSNSKTSSWGQCKRMGESGSGTKSPSPFWWHMFELYLMQRTVRDVLCYRCSCQQECDYPVPVLQDHFKFWDWLARKNSVYTYPLVICCHNEDLLCAILWSHGENVKDEGFVLLKTSVLLPLRLWGWGIRIISASGLAGQHSPRVCRPESVSIGRFS